MPTSLKILERLLPQIYTGALDKFLNGQALKDMKAGTKTKNKKVTSEESKRYLREETSLKYEYQLYEHIKNRIFILKERLSIE